jgi:hypothetical protein
MPFTGAYPSVVYASYPMIGQAVESDVKSPKTKHAVPPAFASYREVYVDSVIEAEFALHSRTIYAD